MRLSRLALVEGALLAGALGCMLAACDSQGTVLLPGDDGGTAADSQAFDGTSTDASTDGMEPDVAADSEGGSEAQADAPQDGGVFVYPDAAADCGIGDSGEPLDLSCTGLYSDWSSKTIAPGIEAYEPGYVLWSDGALKSRWIALPPGQQIDTSSMDEWTFPVGTRIWKEFSLQLDDSGTPTRVETRLLWKQGPSAWYRTTYRWSSDGQTSATELTSGETNVAGTTYEIPSQSDCFACHMGRHDGVLGFEAVALSASSASGLTMAQLEAQGLVTTMPSGSLQVPGDATAAAALGWLHVNCGIACHNSGNGLASDTGFFMRLNADSLTGVQTTDTYKTGWNTPTQNFAIPDAGTTYRFHACDVPESAAYYRANHRQGLNGTPPGIQMPPLVTHTVDDADMTALAAWIDEGCGGSNDAGTSD